MWKEQKKAIENGQFDIKISEPTELEELKSELAREIESLGNKGYQISVIDEDGSEATSLNVTKLDKEREVAIKKHFKEKRAQLLAQMKIADEKLVKYNEEYEKLFKELQTVTSQSNERKTQLEKTLEQQKIAHVSYYFPFFFFALFFIFNLLWGDSFE